MKQPVDTTPYSFRLSRNPYGRLVLRSGRSACSVSNASAVRRAFWTMFFRILTAEANSSYDGKAKGTGLANMDSTISFSRSSGFLVSSPNMRHRQVVSDTVGRLSKGALSDTPNPAYHPC